MSLDFESLGLTEIIRLQNQLSEVLTRRFERTVAVAFSDIVGSTAYFGRFGDEAGHRLQQRHFDLLQRAIVPAEGKIVDTAGDGALVCFPRLPSAAEALATLQRLILADNASFGSEHRLLTRTGLHWGKVLIDGLVVAGDAVNFCCRVADSAAPGEVRLTQSAFMELPGAARRRCRARPPVTLDGIAEPVPLMVLEWQDPERFPGAVRIEETGEICLLPPQDVIRFGRLRELNGVRANDITLALAEPELTKRISRWHFELHRRPDGLVLRAVSGQPTEVDGRPVGKDEEASVGRGTLVRVSGVLSLRFVGGGLVGADPDDTVTNLMG